MKQECQKFCVFAILMASFGTASVAQDGNVVPNPSFEEVNFNFCGDFGSADQFEMAIVSWFPPTEASPRIVDMDVEPDCWNYVSGSDSIRPHSGKRMISLNLLSGSDYRSYLEVRLKKPLVKGKKYYTEIWVRKRSSSACNNLGLLFSDSLIKIRFNRRLTAGDNKHIMGTLMYTPQVIHQELILASHDWICLKGSFIASSRYQYLLIGNFFSNSLTSSVNFGYPSSAEGIFYYIDDIYVGDEPRDQAVNLKSR